MTTFLPPGYAEFLLGNCDEYEDHAIKAVRYADGSCEITGKPLSPVFIYAVDQDPPDDDDEFPEDETLPCQTS